MPESFFDKYCALKTGTYYLPEDAHIDGSETELMEMDGEGITSSKSIMPCLGTAALDTCTGLALYNKKTKLLGVAHEFAMGANLFNRLLSRIRTNETDAVECHIIGATDQPDNIVLTQLQHHALDGLAKAIESTPNCTIKTFDVGAKPHPSAFIVDSRNGRLIRGTTNVRPGITSVEDFILDFNTSIEFDGTSPEFIATKKKARK